MTESEEWRPVPSHEKFYDVSNHGRMRSWKRLGQQPNRDTRADEPRLMNPTVMPAGYASVMLSEDGQQRRYLVHRLVALAFHGRPEAGRDVCCHNDGNPGNNRAENLRWDTMAGNMADKAEHGTLLRGTSHPTAVLTEDQVMAIAAELSRGERTNQQIANHIGVTIGTVAHISTGNTWGHLTGRPNVSRIGSGRVGGSRKKRGRRADAA